MALLKITSILFLVLLLIPIGSAYIIVQNDITGGNIAFVNTTQNISQSITVPTNSNITTLDYYQVGGLCYYNACNGFLSITNSTGYEILNQSFNPTNTISTLAPTFTLKWDIINPIYLIKGSTYNFTVKSSNAAYPIDIFYSTANPYVGGRAYGTDFITGNPLTSTDDIVFTVAFNTIETIYPINQSTIYKTYPPLTTNINFSWDMTKGYSSNLIVARDVNFNLISIDVNTDSKSINQSLPSGSYWWKVNAIGTSNFSNVSTFTVIDNTTVSTGNGIQGTVYELINDVQTPLNGVTVFISNSTYTASMITGSNGYYIFSNLSNDTYSIVGRTTGYDDSQTELVTVTGTMVSKNIRMNKCKSSFTCNYDSKFIKFIVVDTWASRYPGVTVTAYKGDDVVASHVGTTGSDGDITFFVIKDQSYRMTFVDANQGINEERTITPGEEMEIYILIQPSRNTWWTNQSYTEVGVIGFVVSTNEINATHTYVNATYTDALSQSTWTVYLNQTNHTNGTAPQISIQTVTGANNGTASFIVSGYKGKSYLVNLVGTHSTFGSIKRSFGVGFVGLASQSLDFISNLFKALIAIGIMIFVGAMFGYDSRNQGAAIVCALGWIFLGIGFFAYFDTTSMAAGLSIATIFTIFLNMNERARQEDMT